MNLRGWDVFELSIPKINANDIGIPIDKEF